MAASSALPGIVPPVELDGDLLVDGVFLDNLPAELAQRDGGGRTIAVNVLPPGGGAKWAALARDDGLLRQAARLLHPRAEVRLPPILQLALQGIFLGPLNAAARIAKSVDVFIEPPVGEFWFLDFGAFDAIEAAGYRAARPQLEAWVGQAIASAGRHGQGQAGRGAPAIEASDPARARSEAGPGEAQVLVQGQRRHV
jgi:predicted acylesterase/phospholipase RssA